MSNVELRGVTFWRLWSDEGLRELIERYDEFFTERPRVAIARSRRSLGALALGRRHSSARSRI